MISTKIIIAIVAALAVAGGGAYVYTHVYQKAEVETPIALETKEETKSGMMSLRNLLAMGDQRCTFTVTAPTGATQGTVYVSGGRLRGDYTTTAEAQGEITSHMITDGTEIRMWQEGKTTGFIVDAAANANARASATATLPIGNNRAADLDMSANYDCSSWHADASLFTPPANVEFRSMADMMKAPAGLMPGIGGSASGSASVNIGAGGTGASAGASGSADMKALQCQTCESAPTATAKAQCKAALGCS